jgi:ribosomal RNA-processing protein 8
LLLRQSCLQVRSRFAAGDGSSGEDFRPFLGCLQQLGFKLVKQDASNRMFVVFVLKKQQQAAAGPAAGIKWPPLKACVYKRR